MANIQTCNICGKKFDLGHFKGGLYTYIQNKGYLPTCNICRENLSREGVIPCIKSTWHHLGSTCELCGMKD